MLSPFIIQKWHSCKGNEAHILMRKNVKKDSPVDGVQINVKVAPNPTYRIYLNFVKSVC